MTIRRSGRATPEGRTLRPGKAMAFKPSLADQKRASLAAQQAMAHAGMSDAAKQHLAEFAATVKPKIERGPRKPRTAEQGKSEGEVQNEIIAMLCNHPAVHLLIRHNSGAIKSQQYYVEFNHVYLPKKYHAPWPKVTPEMALADLGGLLIDGKPFAIEVKEELWRRASSGDKAIREQAQENYLAHVRACGGIGIFSASVEDVRVALVAAGY